MSSSNRSRSALPAPETFDGADARAGQPLLQFEDLRVVGRDDEDVVECDRRFLTVAVDPGRFRGKDFRDEFFDLVGLLRGGVLIAVVSDRQIAKTGPVIRLPDLISCRSRPGRECRRPS